MIEEMPNGVMINKTFIPAVNLQVENHPGWMPNMGVIGATEAWYPLYFEIMFETGDLWCVTQGDHPEEPDKIMVEVHKSWANHHYVDPDMTVYPGTWDEFLELYKGTATGHMMVA